MSEIEELEALEEGLWQNYQELVARIEDMKGEDGNDLARAKVEREVALWRHQKCVEEILSIHRQMLLESMVEQQEK